MIWNFVLLSKNNSSLGYKIKPNLGLFILKLFNTCFQLGTDKLQKKKTPSFQHPLQANCFDATWTVPNYCYLQSKQHTLIITAFKKKVGKHVIEGHKELISLTEEKITTQWITWPLEVQDFYPIMSAKFLQKSTLASWCDLKLCVVLSKKTFHAISYPENKANFSLPSLLDSKQTRPLRHVSVTSVMLVAHLPIAWIVAAANCLSWLFT